MSEKPGALAPAARRAAESIAAAARAQPVFAINGHPHPNGWEEKGNCRSEYRPSPLAGGRAIAPGPVPRGREGGGSMRRLIALLQLAQASCTAGDRPACARIAFA